VWTFIDGATITKRPSAAGWCSLLSTTEPDGVFWWSFTVHNLF